MSTISEATDESKLGGVTETGTVISNLPLLFADGMPTSLEIISETQIEKFIVLMLNCAAGREYFCRDNMPVPIWWPDDVPFSIPITKPPHVEKSQWLPSLKSLVKHCYSYHGCQFMLKFCFDLAKYPSHLLKFVDLCDGTTSLHNKKTGKLLVTFRNQNLIYDRAETCSPRKYLLPRGGKGTAGLPRAHLMGPPTFIDIYLCDSCDAEFETLSGVREHERTCQQEHCDQIPQSLRSISPDDFQEIDQLKFLHYFEICDRTDVETPIQKRMPRPVPFKGKYQSSPSFIRCASVPISSPLGIVLRKNTPRSFYHVSQTHIDRLERFCLPSKQNSRTTWTHNKTESKKYHPDWVHTYSFSKYQRLSKYETLETGLSLRSRRLLEKCPRLEVAVTRLTQEQIFQYKSGVSKRIPATSKSSIPILKDAKSTIPTLKDAKSTLPILKDAKSTLPILKVAKSPIPILKVAKLTIPILKDAKSTLPILKDAKSTTPILKVTKSTTPILKVTKSAVSHTHNPIPVIDLCSSEDEDSCIDSSVRPPTSELVKILMNDSMVKSTDDSCSSEFINKHCETIVKALPSKYLSRNLPNNKSKRKSATVHKRSKRGRKSLACENETVIVKQGKRKIKLFDSPLQNEAKSKLQELNKIKESCDTKSKDWYQQFLSSSQTNHDGKKYSTVV